MLFACLLVSVAICDQIPEDVSRIQVVETDANGKFEGIAIKVNGEHRDNGEEIYMQVNLNVAIKEGNVLVNNIVLPFAELSTLTLQAEICEIKEGVQGDFEGAAVTVNFFLHEQLEAERGEVSRAFRLETQIVETDKYDVHMYNVTEVVMELDSTQQELRRTVTLIDETTSKLHAARECPKFKCPMLLGCSAYKKDGAGCQTCDCAAMMHSPVALDAPGAACLSSCEDMCQGDSFLDDPSQDAHGCWICPCLVIDSFEPSTATIGGCVDLANTMVERFEMLPFPVRVASIALLACISAILTVTCCVTICCRSPRARKANVQNNLKAFGFGKLQIYVPDYEKKTPLIDNLDVVSADIA